MHPELINIFGFTIAWYGVLITAGVMFGAMIATRYARERGLNENLLSDMIIWSVLWGVVGARVFYVLTSLDEFRGASFIDIINIRRGGISIHGGLIFGIGVLLYYQWRYRINLYRYADLMVPGVALGIIGGRLGNFFNGSDTMGRMTGWPIGYTWPDAGSPILGIFKSPVNWTGFAGGFCRTANDIFMTPAKAFCNGGTFSRGPVHLTQIYGVLIGLALFIGAMYWLRSKKPGWVFWQFWLWYSLLRAGIEETFRLNPLTWKVFLSEGPDKAGIGLFTLTQLVSIPLVLWSVYMLYKISRAPILPNDGLPLGMNSPAFMAGGEKKL